MELDLLYVLLFVSTIVDIATLFVPFFCPYSALRLGYHSPCSALVTFVLLYLLYYVYFWQLE